MALLPSQGDVVSLVTAYNGAYNDGFRDYIVYHFSVSVHIWDTTVSFDQILFQQLVKLWIQTSLVITLLLGAINYWLLYERHINSSDDQQGGLKYNAVQQFLFGSLPHCGNKPSKNCCNTTTGSILDMLHIWFVLIILILIFSPFETLFMTDSAVWIAEKTYVWVVTG